MKDYVPENETWICQKDYIKGGDVSMSGPKHIYPDKSMIT